MKKNTLSLLMMAVLATTGISSAFASPEEDAIKTSLKDQFNWDIEQIEPSPVKGLWQVWVQRRLFYVDENAQHLIAGPIVTRRRARTFQKRKKANGAGPLSPVKMQLSRFLVTVAVKLWSSLTPTARIVLRWNVFLKR